MSTLKFFEKPIYKSAKNRENKHEKVSGGFDVYISFFWIRAWGGR